MNTIGERLVYARKLRGFTQVELSEASYVSRAVIANIETGRFSAQTVALVAICNALNINKDWLIDGIGEMEPENERSKILDELYKVCANLTEPQQLFLLETIRAMQKYQVVEMEKPEEKHETTALRTLIESAESCSSKSRFRGKSKDREL